MKYQLITDISHEPTRSEVKEFAKGHGCTATLLIKNGPAGGNPVYKFASNKFSYLEELAGQLNIPETDIETIQDII